MKYFITGRGGFIGKNLELWVKMKGHEIIDHPEIYEDLEIVHLAAYGNHYNQKDPHEIISVNLIFLLEKIKQAQRCFGLKKFYNVSTSSVILSNQTMYSASKLLGEKIIESLNDERFVNIRPYSVYGPGEAAHRFIPTVIRALHSGEGIELDPQASHDWIFVTDFIELMFSGHRNIGTGIQHTNIEVVKMLEEISGLKLKYMEKKLRSYDTDKWVCPEKLSSRSLYNGLKQTYEFNRKDN